MKSKSLVPIFNFSPARRRLLALVMAGGFSILNYSFAQSPNWLWAKSIGDTLREYGNSIAVDVYGNVYTTGRFEGTVDFDPGAGIFNLTSAAGTHINIFISKLDASGNFVWAKAMGGANASGAEGFSIAIDALGNVYTTGFFSGTADFDPNIGVWNLYSNGSSAIFVSKLDSSGNFIWAKAMVGTAGGSGHSLAVDPSGNVYTTGEFMGTTDFNPGIGAFSLTSSSSNWPDIFISKLDSSGNFVWAKAIGGVNDDKGYSIAIDPAGNGDVYITGRFMGTVDFDPGTGVFNLTGTNFISKLDSSGNFIWAKVSGGYYIALDSFGNVYTTGFFSGTVDFDPGAGTFNLTSAGQADIFISKLDGSGNFVWAKAMGGSINDVGASLAVDASGNVYAIGYFSGTGDFDPGPGTLNLTTAGLYDIFISKIDNSGNFVWVKAVGGTSYDYGLSIAISTSGNIHVTGYFQSGSLSFGAYALIFAGGAAYTYDTFIAKMDTLVNGINEAENFTNGFIISPNPFATQATITFGKEISDAALRIYNLYGQLVQERKNINGKEIILTRQNLDCGVYFYEVEEKGKKNYAGKVMIY